MGECTARTQIKGWLDGLNRTLLQIVLKCSKTVGIVLRFFLHFLKRQNLFFTGLVKHFRNVVAGPS